MATTTTSTLASYFTNDTQFRANSGIATAIQAVNIIKTSDTGQINWGTVTKPSASYTSAGYEIFRFNDSLQSTFPVYIRFDYSTSIGANYFGIYITVGTGTNGAGTLTGNVSTTMLVGASNGSDTSYPTNRASYFSGDTNRLCMALYPNAADPTYNWIVFSIERTHDTSGADTGDGAHIFSSSNLAGGPTAACQYLPLGTTTAYLPSMISGGWYCSAPLTGTGALSPDIYTYPIKNYAPYETLPIFNLVHYLGTDITASTTVSITGYDGTSRSYYATGLRNAYAGWLAFVGAQTGGVNTGVGLLMRYD